MIRFVLISALLLLMAGAAQAETPQERLVAALTAEGYVIVETERTWLGRLRIVAIRGDVRREVVINPGTGEVLRDIARTGEEAEGAGAEGQAVAGNAAPAPTVGTAGSGAPVTPATGGAAAEDGGAARSDDVLLPEAGVMQ